MRGLGGQAELRTRYELEGELGRGAGGVVYSARDREGRAVAIKLGHRRAPASGASIPRSLQHEHLVTVHERGVEDDLPYLVMERIAGCDLTAYCSRERRLPLGVTVSIMTCVARALAFLHARGVVHGDVKPGNVLYSAVDGVVKLVDFAADCRGGLWPSGTPAYLAPEQVCGEACSAASDQFAFGVTLYQLLCGSLPFTAASLPQFLFAIAHAPAADIREHDPALPQALAGMVQRALEKAPAARFPSMRAVAAELATLAA